MCTEIVYFFIELRHNYNDQLPEKLFGDKDKIKQITSNLISNAIKYTEEGSIDFNVDCELKDDNCLLKIIFLNAMQCAKAELSID